MSLLARTDPAVYEAILQETRRQADQLELIASENFTSRAVLEAMANPMTNKYAEGLPGKRYYGGCEFVDVVEDLARDRVRALYGAEHANVQPHSGAQANMAAYFAVMEPGDTMLAMDLSHGGHLTHGSPVNFSGFLFNVVPYGVARDDETIDYDQVARLAEEHRPKVIVSGASAYPRIVDYLRMQEIARSVGAYHIVDMAHWAGLVAGGAHPNPVPHADIVTSTTHKTLRGPRGGFILCTKELAKAVDKKVFPGTQGGPLMHVIAAKAVCFAEAARPDFREYAHQIVENARSLADGLDERGYHLCSRGTDTHLCLVNLQNKGLTGKEAEEALEACRITVNKNTVPFETRSPFIASGIRLGTPALTTRGMGPQEMVEIAELIDRVLSSPGDEAVAESVRARVAELCRAFPLYEDLYPVEAETSG